MIIEQGGREGIDTRSASFAEGPYKGAVAIKPENRKQHIPGKVCMHVLGTARTDVRVMREATALAQVGMDITIIDIERDHTRPREEDLNGIHLKHIVMPDWFLPLRFKLWFLVKMARMFILGTLALLSTPTDVFHAHDDTALPACYIAARLRRKPLIFDAHELPLVEPNFTRWQRLHAVSTRLLKGMMARCSGIITVSEPIMRELQRLYGGRKAEVIRNIPAFQAPISSNRLREYLGLNSDVRIALYQGNLDSRGLDRLIPSAKFLDPGIVIVLMGKGPGTLQSRFETLIQREEVSDRVKIIPPVPYAELLTWTASADLGLIVYAPSAAPTLTPNIRMCLPNKLFEYLMAGLPVLGSSLDAVVDIIKTYDVGGVVSSLEPEEIGRAISTMLDDRSGLARMHKNALAATAHDLCWENESSRLIDLYQNVLKEKRSVRVHEETFNAQRYWEERLSAHPDITGVGYLGRSEQFVEKQYHSRKQQVELALREYGLADLDGRTVLDIGSGTGIWLNFWHQHRADRVVGLDFAQPSVDRLQKQFPHDLIVQADVSVAPLPLPPDTPCFDVISAFDVLLHIVDPDGMRCAIANLASHCAPGGWLIISDPIVQGQGYVAPPSRATYSKVRSVAEYREVLEEHGFVIDSIRPATVLLSDPLEAPNRLSFLALKAYWKVTALWGRSSRLSHLIGPGATMADQLACRLCSHGYSPGAKLIFARKRD